MRFAVYLVGNASAMFKAAVICVALIRAFGMYTCEFVRVTEICSTNTTCADRPGRTMTAATARTLLRPKDGGRACNATLELSLQLHNCQTALPQPGISR